MATSWLPRVRQALAQPDLALAILSLLFLLSFAKVKYPRMPIYDA
jgi:hypothetical protein